MPLAQSLDILRQQLRQSRSSRPCSTTCTRRCGPAPRFRRLRRARRAVPGVYTASLMAGERSGNLDAVLRRFVAYAKVVDAVKARRLGADLPGDSDLACRCRPGRHHRLKVVPAFPEFYGELRRRAAARRRGSSSRISNLVRTTCLFLLVAAVGRRRCGWSWLRSAGPTGAVRPLVLRLPALGASPRKFATSQFARTLATLLGGGIPLVNALEIAARVGRQPVRRRRARVVAQQVREGRALAAALPSGVCSRTWR